MRMPNSTEMSSEQKNIYQDAPLDGSVLITGPPGTGKTVIAFLRAQTAVKMEIQTSVAMYNRVLSSFTDNQSDEGFDVSTLHQWVYRWWMRMNAVVASSGDVSEYILNCPFSEKDQAKSLGAKWNPRLKKWYVPMETYRANSPGFTRWNPQPGNVSKDSSKAPTMPGDRFQFDWKKIFETVYEQNLSGKINTRNVNWGHLIIDEAQDFSPEMFKTLNKIQEFIFRESPEDEKPALTILADENQRLQKTINSSINDIRESLSICPDREYRLSRNYRNTLEIAELASFFYAGLSTGKPDLPEGRGDLPVLVKTDKISDAVDYIYRYAINHDSEEIGVITQNNHDRARFVAGLIDRIDEDTGLVVQSYASGDPDWKDSTKLVFDEGGIISVINKQSSKGLEFDTVFLPELQGISVAPQDSDQFKMEMYVMLSRGRYSLYLMYSNEGTGQPQILSLIPDENSDLLEYENGN